ncbi:hypothetical protein OG883_29660 [Streptomyces sp. NBC_01142]|uniref:hypothetical protein n=1 Tax=Streptomyces sp. NBC_01142 TaxID=2975865 RepID=UPI00225593F2|nr:hypothetical protein [Streptomyces sp. NBC_01142]MCX4823969.1 hypothetical protein [Streptomyces sp. NBC_01142]
MRPARLFPHASVRAAAVFALSAGLTLPALATAPAAFAVGTGTATTAARTAGAAAAAPVPVTRTDTFDDGRLDIGLPYNALWVKVNVFAPGQQPGAAPLLSTDELSWHDYTSSRPGGWATDQPLRLPEGSAFGDYPVTVDYRMPGGTIQHWEGGGKLSYRLHTGVSGLAFDRESTDYEHRDAVLTGTATTLDPSTGLRTPAHEGTKVKVGFRMYGTDWTDLAKTATVTGNGGGFSLPLTPGADVRGGGATVEATADTDPDDAAEVPDLPISKTKYRISADLSKKRVHKGDSVTVTGRAERLTPGGWKPFTGATVISTPREPDTSRHEVGTVMGSSTVGEDGTFTYPAKAAYTTGVHTYLKPSVYYADLPYDRGDIAVPKAFKYTNVKIELSPYGKVRATGRLAADWCWDERVTLQYSADGKTWVNLRHGVAEGGTAGYCPFTIENDGFVNAYYRIAHAENDNFLAQNSAPVRLTRTLTRFSSFSVSPTRPHKDARFTASGTLQQHTGGKWQGYKGAKVTLLFKPKGENQWYWVAKGTTGSSGKYSLKGTAYGDGHWAMALQPDSKHFYSESKMKYVDVR